MAFQSAFVATVTQDNFGIIRSETDEVCDNGLHVRRSFALSVMEDFLEESRRFS